MATEADNQPPQNRKKPGTIQIEQQGNSPVSKNQAPMPVTIIQEKLVSRTYTPRQQHVKHVRVSYVIRGANWALAVSKNDVSLPPLSRCCRVAAAWCLVEAAVIDEPSRARSRGNDPRKARAVCLA